MAHVFFLHASVMDVFRWFFSLCARVRADLCLGPGLYGAFQLLRQRLVVDPIFGRPFWMCRRGARFDEIIVCVSAKNHDLRPFRSGNSGTLGVTKSSNFFPFAVRPCPEADLFLGLEHMRRECDCAGGSLLAPIFNFGVRCRRRANVRH